MFKTTSVDALIKGSAKLIADLEAASAFHGNAADKHLDAAAVSKRNADASRDEAHRASTIATNLKGIFS